MLPSPMKTCLTFDRGGDASIMGWPADTMRGCRSKSRNNRSVLLQRLQ